MTSAAGGDRRAFELLYQRFARPVHGILLTHVGVEHADDMVQEVFFHAWSHLPNLREPAAFPGWICTMARRRAVDLQRRLKPVAPLPDTLPHAAEAETRARALEALEAIRALPEAYRETLALRLVEGMSGPEIAEATGLTHDSVRVNLSRGMRMLRERLGGER